MTTWKRSLALALAMLLAASCLNGVTLRVRAEETEAETTAETAIETTEETTAETAAAEAATEPAEETIPQETVAAVQTPAVMSAAEETEETQDTVMYTQSVVADVYLPENDELYVGYLEQLFYGGNSVSFLGEAAREQLGAADQELYDSLKEQIQTVAAGKSSSTVFTVSASEMPSWDGSFSSLNFQSVFDALLHDCPYELYWYDKTSSSPISSNGYTIWFCFPVAGNYQPSGYDPDEPTVDTSAAATAAAAVSRAKSIVNKYADSSDYGKLKGYKEEICALVEYDDNAAAGNYFSTDNDPWQLIHVFDGDTSTKVVCEGYAKAFQYLCDLSTFNGDVACYTVTGVMAHGTGAGGHMWNIVTIGGNNYIVDVTNSDYGTVGYDWDGDGESLLFLTGTSGSITGGYNFSGTTFAYDSNTMALWGTGNDSILKLSATNFDPSGYEEPKEEEPDDLVFSNYEELKELASRSYDELTVIEYDGESPLVIEGDLTFPENLSLTLIATEVVVAEDAAFINDSENLMIGNLTVEGSFVNNGYLQVPTVLDVDGSFTNNADVIVSGELNVEGSLYLYGFISMAPGFTGVYGSENITYGEYGVLDFAYMIDDMADLEEAAAAARTAENPNWEFSLNVGNYTVLVDESLAIPENCTMWIYGGAALVVEKGCTLELNCYTYIEDYSSIIVNGTLENNGIIDLYYDDGGSLTVANGGKYAGFGVLYVNSYEASLPTAAIPGLDLDDFMVEGFNDIYGHYWALMLLEGVNARLDLTGDGELTEADAVYLLWYTMFPEMYPVELDMDFNIDGDITSEDAVILLWYALFQDSYDVYSLK